MEGKAQKKQDKQEAQGQNKEIQIHNQNKYKQTRLTEYFKCHPHKKIIHYMIFTRNTLKYKGMQMLNNGKWKQKKRYHWQH